MADKPSVAIATMPGLNGGRLNIGGSPGRPKSRVGEAVRSARDDLMTCRDRLLGIVNDPKSNADDVVKASIGLLRISGLERDRPRPRKRSTFSVVTATPDEQARKLTNAGELTNAPIEARDTDPNAGAPA